MNIFFLLVIYSWCMGASYASPWEFLKVGAKQVAGAVKAVPKKELFKNGLIYGAAPALTAAAVITVAQLLEDSQDGEEREDLSQYFPIRVSIGETFHKTYEQREWKSILSDIQKNLGTVSSFCLIGEDNEEQLQLTKKGIAKLLLRAADTDNETKLKICSPSSK